MTEAAGALRDPGFTWAKECGQCRRRYDLPRWHALTPHATVPPDSVQKHLTVSAGFAVDLRRCLCGAILAVRKSP